MLYVCCQSDCASCPLAADNVVPYLTLRSRNAGLSACRDLEYEYLTDQSSCLSDQPKIRVQCFYLSVYYYIASSNSQLS